MIYFNWYELRSASTNVPEGIIALTHALALGYNSVISLNESDLLKKLNIGYIPSQLYRNYHFVYGNFGIVTKFKTTEPQAYFINSSWIYDFNSLDHKMLYLYALSQRSIYKKNFFIPDNYLDNKYWNNPYLKHRNGKIWFLPEISNLTSKLKPKEKQNGSMGPN